MKMQDNYDREKYIKRRSSSWMPKGVKMSLSPGKKTHMKHKTYNDYCAYEKWLKNINVVCTKAQTPKMVIK